MVKVLKEREKQIYRKGTETFSMTCETRSTAGSVSQRACVFCGSRVVLYPIADALHLIHGPIGCASYTWDIRGSLSSGPELHRYSFSTDLQEKDVIYGAEKKLYKALVSLIDLHAPRAAFVYATCIIGIIGDDMAAVCKRVSAEKNIPVIPVHSEGFKGTKKDGYKAACDALFTLIGQTPIAVCDPLSINILGEFNLAGEAWIIKEYYKKMGVNVISVMTGDARIDEIKRAHGAALNVVQCSGSMTSLAEMMKEKYGIPYIRVSYFGIEDMAESLYNVARHFKAFPLVMVRAQALVRSEVSALYPKLEHFKKGLTGKRAAIYVGGAFKAFSLIKALRTLGMKVVLVGSQTGNKKDYALLKDICDDDVIILDDSNPVELAHFSIEKKADLFIGGVKERPLAYKLGIGFCDHNHERKIPLAGFIGMYNFAREVYGTVMSPVWSLRKKKYEC
jgi:nitrogenase molybdenum-cofactor synthesis protein NifE